MSNERIENLELKYAYQEQAINEMSDIIYQQQKKIERMEELLRAVMEKATENESGASHVTSLLDEIPPHY